MKFPNRFLLATLCFLIYKLPCSVVLFCEAMQSSNIITTTQDFTPSPNNSPGIGAVLQTEQILGVTLEPTVALVEESVSDPKNFIIDLHSQFTPEYGCLDILENGYQLNDLAKEYVNNK